MNYLTELTTNYLNKDTAEKWACFLVDPARVFLGHRYELLKTNDHGDTFIQKDIRSKTEIAIAIVKIIFIYVPTLGIAFFIGCYLANHSKTHQIKSTVLNSEARRNYHPLPAADISPDVRVANKQQISTIKITLITEAIRQNVNLAHPEMYNVRNERTDTQDLDIRIFFELLLVAHNTHNTHSFFDLLEQADRRWFQSNEMFNFLLMTIQDNRLNETSLILNRMNGNEFIYGHNNRILNVLHFVDSLTEGQLSAILRKCNTSEEFPNLLCAKTPDGHTILDLLLQHPSLDNLAKIRTLFQDENVSQTHQKFLLHRSNPAFRTQANYQAFQQLAERTDNAAEYVEILRKIF